MDNTIGYWDPISEKIVDVDGNTLVRRRFSTLESAEAYARHYTNIQMMGHYYSTTAARELLDGLLAVA